MRLPFGKAIAWPLAALLFTGATLDAQSQDSPLTELHVVPFFRDVVRVESWAFFEPKDPDANPDYSLFSNRATLGVRVDSRRFDVVGSFQYAQVAGLPRRATGPGPLGPGAMYFDAARTPAAYQLYFKALSMRVKNITPGVSVQAGRMGFDSGLDARSSSSLIERLKRDRLAGRLVGQVEWSVFERAFDGIRIDVERPAWHATSALLFPTQGGFEESANPTIDEVSVATASLTLRTHGDLQFFALHYRDQRMMAARPDNTGIPTTAADISVATVGASHIGVYPAGPGRADMVIWVAGQFGDWYGDDHRALSVIAEGGYQWSSRWSPWIRVGWLYASGDANAADFRHGTFFPMLPSTRPDLFAATFAQMNLRDVSAELRLHPHSRVDLRADVHRMSLANAMDRWYTGAGATARRGDFFGYASRPSFGSTDLGTLWQLSAQVPINRRWTVKGAIGTVKGGQVVRRQFAGNRLTVFTLESALAF